MKASLLIKLVLGAGLLSSSLDASPAVPTHSNSDGQQTTVVLVHGAFADGSSWSKVIPLLQQQGYRVVAVQNPLISQEGDVANTRRVIESQPGPVIAVGHSYGGAVITGAAAGNSQVKALVYVAALVPEASEPLGQLYNSFGPSELGAALVPDSGGYLTIDRNRLHELFAHDVTAEEAQVMAVTQKPIAASIFEQSVPVAAWKNIPSYFLVATGDRAIKRDLQLHLAKRINAKVAEVNTSHVPFLSQPEAVANFIARAARETRAQ